MKKFAKILVPFLLLIVYQGLNCVKVFRMYKAEQMAELQAEKDALEAQKKQSEDMMAQLLAIQQQLNRQKQTDAPPAPAQEPVATQPDMAAMMAELQALRAQVAAQNEAKECPKAPETAEEHIGNSEENEL